MGLGENKYGTENGVINLRAVKHALNVYISANFHAPYLKRRRSLKFDYEIQFGHYNAFETLIFILNILFRFRISQFTLGASKIMYRMTYFSKNFLIINFQLLEFTTNLHMQVIYLSAYMC